MRSGPKPLSYHISMAATSCGDEAAQARLSSMLRGIQKYQKFAGERYTRAQQVVWQKGSVQLLHYKVQSAKQLEPVFLIPSLVNGYEIFDLCTQRSFARWLTQQGHDVYLLDWGALCEDPDQSSLDMLLRERLQSALQFINTQNEKPAHILGYCIGGVLAAKLAAISPEQTATLTLLASPWDFHAQDWGLGQAVKRWSIEKRDEFNTLGYVPADWMHALFASLAPEVAQAKFARFWEMEEGSAEENIFVAVEDWLADTKDLPGGIARQILRNWFENNAKDIESLDISSLVIASKKDDLVSMQSALAATRFLKDAQLIQPDCGHIGMMAGRHAVEQVWKPLAEFFAAHSAKRLASAA